MHSRIFSFVRCVRHGLILSVCLAGFSPAVLAGTIVRVDSSLGPFTLELFDQQAPNTVANFLDYVESGRYQFTMIHLSATTFLVGGGFHYNRCSEGPVAISSDPPIAAEATGFTNTLGTIAMVRNNDGTVQNQWRINIGDNSNAGDPLTNPVVFGEVVEGLETVFLIGDLFKTAMDLSPSVPVINYFQFFVDCGSFTRDNLVFTSMTVESPDSGTPPVFFDEASGLLNVKVDTGGTGLIELSFSIFAADPDVVIKALPESVAPLAESVANIATFDAVTGELFIPELTINGEVAFRDVRFVLSDLTNLLFTLQSFTQ